MTLHDGRSIAISRGNVGDQLRSGKVEGDQLRSSLGDQRRSERWVYRQPVFLKCMDSFSDSDTTTTVVVNGRSITLTNEQLERVVKQADSADNHSLLVAKMVEAGSAVKITISKSDSKRPMGTWNVSMKQGECQIFGVLRVMRGKSGVTSMADQKKALLGQFPQALDLTSV